MKLISTVCGSLLVLAALALTLDCATGDPSVNYNSSKSNTGNLTVDNPCPAGEAVTTNAATGRKSCAMPAKSINYNASKSNTGNFTDEGTNSTSSRSGRPTSSARYHCGKGEYTLQNGDCVPNPPSKPND
jgi:hypothetical protein